ncbi:MAG: hypothetical protein N2645_10260 [Clostridia bacterium]|nr:hypothetical protein [Clostridia bacterium]
MAERGFLGGIFDNDTILWFIVLFLLLFWGCRGPACFGPDNC